MEEKDKLVQKIEELNKYMKDSVSPKGVFVRGILAGIGTAIGATLIAGILIFLSVRVVSRLDIPIINDLIEQINISTKSNTELKD